MKSIYRKNNYPESPEKTTQVGGNHVHFDNDGEGVP